MGKHDSQRSLIRARTIVVPQAVAPPRKCHPERSSLGPRRSWGKRSEGPASSDIHTITKPVIPTLSKKLVILTGAKPGAPGLDSETWESSEPMRAGFCFHFVDARL